MIEFTEDQLIDDMPAQRVGDKLIWASGLEMDISGLVDYIIDEFRSLPAYVVIQIADMEEEGEI